MEETQEEEEEEDSLMEEEDHQEEDHREEDSQGEAITTITSDEDRTNWWGTLQRYSKEYERKLSLSLPFGGSTQALTAKIPPSPTRTRGASYFSHTFKGTMWQNGFRR